jgi:hypothetical protein
MVLTDIAQILLDAGVSPSYGLQHSLSALQYNVLTANYDTLRGLLNDGADINIVDENGRRERKMMMIELSIVQREEDRHI